MYDTLTTAAEDYDGDDDDDGDGKRRGVLVVRGLFKDRTDEETVDENRVVGGVVWCWLFGLGSFGWWFIWWVCEFCEYRATDGRLLLLLRLVGWLQDGLARAHG